MTPKRITHLPIKMDWMLALKLIFMAGILCIGFYKMPASPIAKKVTTSTFSVTNN